MYTIFSKKVSLLQMTTCAFLDLQATVLCDIVVMYLLKKGAFYKEKKYQVITDDDYFKGLMESDTHQDYGSLQVLVYRQPLLRAHYCY